VSARIRGAIDAALSAELDRVVTKKSHGRRAYCPTCDLVEHVDEQWRCLWCDTVTMAGQITRAREAKFASTRVVREAHRLHAEGMTVREAAIATISQTGYFNVHGYEATLRESWALLGLPTRGRSAGQRLRKRMRPIPPRASSTQHYAYRHDVDTAELVRIYDREKSTTRAAALVGMSQQGAYGRLVNAGVITPKPRRAARPRTPTETR